VFSFSPGLSLSTPINGLVGLRPLGRFVGVPYPSVESLPSTVFSLPSLFPPCPETPVTLLRGDREFAGQLLAFLNDPCHQFSFSPDQRSSNAVSPVMQQAPRRTFRFRTPPDHRHAFLSFQVFSLPLRHLCALASISRSELDALFSPPKVMLRAARTDPFHSATL